MHFLAGVMLNIRDICKTKQSKYWKKHAEEGTPAWQKITVALIVDGLEAMDKVDFNSCIRDEFCVDVGLVGA